MSELSVRSSRRETKLHLTYGANCSLRAAAILLKSPSATPPSPLRRMTVALACTAGPDAAPDAVGVAVCVSMTESQSEEPTSARGRDTRYLFSAIFRSLPPLLEMRVARGVWATLLALCSVSATTTLDCNLTSDSQADIARWNLLTSITFSRECKTPRSLLG